MKTIDAENRTIGRVVTEVAKVLMGKDRPDYKPNVALTEKVQIINASKAKIDPRKMDDKKYTRYTGHPGGLRVMTLGKMIEKNGYSEPFKKAVYGMLPSNKLRAIRMKSLEILD